MNNNTFVAAVALLLHYVEKKRISFFLIPALYSNGVKMIEINAYGFVLYLVNLIKAGKSIPAFLTIRPNERNFRLSSRRTRNCLPADIVNERYTVDLPYRTISAMLADNKYADIEKPCRKWEKVAYDAIVRNDVYNLLDIEFTADSLENVDIITTQKTKGYKSRYECKYSEGLLCYGGHIKPHEIDSYIERIKAMVEY